VRSDPLGGGVDPGAVAPADRHLHALVGEGACAREAEAGGGGGDGGASPVDPEVHALTVHSATTSTQGETCRTSQTRSISVIWTRSPTPTSTRTGTRTRTSRTPTRRWCGPRAATSRWSAA